MDLESLKNAELKNLDWIKFDDNIKIDQRIPKEYYELYGDCAPTMFWKENVKANIDSAYRKNNSLGKVVEKYYRVFCGYRTNEDSMNAVFKSMKWLFDDREFLSSKKNINSF